MDPLLVRGHVPSAVALTAARPGPVGAFARLAGMADGERRRQRCAWGAILSTALLLVGCSGGDQEAAKPTKSPSASPSAQPTASPTPDVRRWPLTGRRAEHPLPKRRAVVVKIENTGNSAPQVGLGAADLVVQQLVEGGLTRLAVFYHSRVPSDVGPVRSLRTSDIGIVKPADALLVASGGARRALRRMESARVRLVTGGDAYHRVDGRPAPYDLFVRLSRLAKARAKGEPPEPYLPWGDAKALGTGKPAGRIEARYSRGTVNSWTYRGRTYRRSIDHATGRDDFRVDAVLALRVAVTDAGYRDPAGNAVPETILSGKGAATLFHHGRAYEGRWYKRSPGAPLRLATTTGRPLRVPPGNTWVELVPSSGGDLRYGR